MSTEDASILLNTHKHTDIILLVWNKDILLAYSHFLISEQILKY